MQPTREELMAIAGMNQGPSKEELMAIAGIEAEPVRPKVNMDVQHPDVGFGDRALIKNLGDTISGIKYLKDKLPSHDIKEMNGEIVLKAPGEKEYKPVDPKGLDMQDFTDIAYDVGAGVTEGAAAIGGAILGNLPGAAVGGGLAGAGLEAMRQKLGQALGLPQDVDMEQVALSGAFGAASPALLGVGGQGTLKLAEKMFAKAGIRGGQEMMESGAKKLAAQQAAGAMGDITERGILPIMAQKGTVKMADALTGIKGELFERAIDKGDTLKEIFPDPADYADKALDTISTQIAGAKDQIGSQIGEQLRNSGEVLDVSDARKILTSHLQRTGDDVNKQIMRLKEMGVPEKTISSRIYDSPQMDAYRDAKALYNDGFGWTGGADIVEADNAFRIKEALNDYTHLQQTAAMEGKRKPMDKMLMNRARSAASGIAESINTIPGAKELNNEFSSLAKLKGRFDKTFNPSNEETALKRLIRAGATKDPNYTKLAKSIDNKFGTQLEETSKDLAAQHLAENAGWMSHNISGLTKSAPTQIARYGGGALGYQLGGAQGAAVGAGAGIALTSPRAYMLYLKSLRNAEKMMPGSAGRAALYNTLVERPVGQPEN